MRWKCTCAYDGTDFEGWQRQPHGKAVQNHIEAALTRIFNQTTLIHGSGRTDAGVHAKGQVFHFDAEWNHPPEKLLRALHSLLTKQIKIVSAVPVADDFHARYSVYGKRYVYRYHLGRAGPMQERYVWACRDLPVQLDVMNAAAQRLIGTHDFTAFSATHSKDNDPNPIKTLHRLGLKQQGRQLTLTTEGSGYLYRMVRSLAGALYAVGRGRLSPDEISALLASRQRTHRIITAPASGLSLDKVFYSKAAS
jgi:tRNA pseudouridine38-40 synthase